MLDPFTRPVEEPQVIRRDSRGGSGEGDRRPVPARPGEQREYADMLALRGEKGPRGQLVRVLEEDRVLCHPERLHEPVERFLHGRLPPIWPIPALTRSGIQGE